MKKLLSGFMVVALVLGVLFNVPVSVAKADTETFNLNQEYTLTHQGQDEYNKEHIVGQFAAQQGKIYKIVYNVNTTVKDGRYKIVIKNALYPTVIDTDFSNSGETTVFSLPKGYYTVSIVTPYLWAEDSSSITFTVKTMDAGDTEDEFNNSFKTAKVIKDTVKGNFAYSTLKDDGDADYFKYTVNADGLVDVSFSLDDPNTISCLDSDYRQSGLLILDSKKHLIDITTITESEFTTKIGVKKGTYYIVPILDKTYGSQMLGVNYTIKVSQKKAKGYEREFNRLPKLADKFGTKAKINFAYDDFGLYMDDRLDGVVFDNDEYVKYDKDYVSAKITSTGTYKISYKPLDSNDTLAPVDVYAFVNGGEGIKLKKDADGNHSLTLKLKKGDVLKCNMNAVQDKQPHIWYKSPLKKVK